MHLPAVIFQRRIVVSSPTNENAYCYPAVLSPWGLLPRENFPQDVATTGIPHPIRFLPRYRFVPPARASMIGGTLTNGEGANAPVPVVDYNSISSSPEAISPLSICQIASQPTFSQSLPVPSFLPAPPPIR